MDLKRLWTSRWWCRKRWCEDCEEFHRMGTWELEEHRGRLAFERRLAAIEEQRLVVERMTAESLERQGFGLRAHRHRPWVKQ